MRVDMSPAAVTARLMLLDELWDLSVELLQAKHLPDDVTRLSETSLAESWNSPEEDEAVATFRRTAREVV